MTKRQTKKPAAQPNPFSPAPPAEASPRSRLRVRITAVSVQVEGASGEQLGQLLGDFMRALVPPAPPALPGEEEGP